ncbi:MAG TPA: translocation/assembly module TamB domain-containing protein, partial [Polyangiaceae bacterium]|nr:translocation/assembly module TamB domain-containing protein [Polyangiaceae bacterium]
LAPVEEPVQSAHERTAQPVQTAPDHIEFAAALRPKTLDASLALRDRFGKWVDLSSNVQLPDGGVRGILAQGKAMVHAPASLEVMLNERRLDKLQGALGLLARKYGAALPLRAKALVALESSGQGITGKVDLSAHVWGEGLDEACAETAEADISLRALLAGDQLEANVSARPKAGGEAKIAVHSKLAVNDLLDGSAFAWGPARITARGAELKLHSMPTLCALPPSRTRFELVADGVGVEPIVSSLRLDVEDIPTQEGPKLGVTVYANTSKEAASAKGDLKLNGGVKGQFNASVPLLYAATPFPSVPLDKPVRAELNLPDFPVSGLTAFTDVIGRAGGRLGARLRLTGTLEKPEPSGSIELKDAALSIAALAQPFSNVNGRIELAPDKVVIRELKARDRNGKLGVGGYAQYNVMRGGKVELHVSADTFPIRQQGSIVGELSTRAKLTGKVDARNKLELTLNIQGGRIWLTGEGGQQVQELDEHPDIRFDTEPVIKSDDSSEEEDAEPAMTLALFRIRSEKDLWLMHEDFAVQVSVDMKLTTEGEGVTLHGQAGITRGRLNLLGKPFDIQKGAIRFTGDVPPDPELDLKAKHTTREGKDLLVQIVGRASAPQIIFSGAANNAGEAVALLTGGGSGRFDPARDAANFAANLTAGLLAVSARRKFGDWVPMLSVE